MPALGQRHQARKKLGDPFLSQFRVKGERKKAGQRFAAHRRDIGETASEAAVSDGAGRMPGATEVNVFYRQVGGDEDFEARLGPQDGTVVANALEHRAIPARLGQAADRGDKCFFR